MNQSLVGIMGGSGLYQMDALQDAQEHVMCTPFGAPSDVLVTGRAQQIVAEAIRLLGTEQPVSESHTALKNALVTQPDAMAPEVHERLALFLT